MLMSKLLPTFNWCEEHRSDRIIKNMMSHVMTIDFTSLYRSGKVCVLHKVCAKPINRDQM